MSFLGKSRSVPRCFTCDVFFKTWNEKKNHDEILHNRYNSTDNQKLEWKSPGNTREKEDYFICEIHKKKLTNDFRCPVISCESKKFIKKSYYVSLQK